MEASSHYFESIKHFPAKIGNIIEVRNCDKCPIIDCGYKSIVSKREGYCLITKTIKGVKIYCKMDSSCVNCLWNKPPLKNGCIAFEIIYDLIKCKKQKRLF